MRLGITHSENNLIIITQNYAKITQRPGKRAILPELRTNYAQITQITQKIRKKYA